MRMTMVVGMCLIFAGSLQAATITNADFELDPLTNGWSGNWQGTPTVTHVIGGGPDGSNCVKLSQPVGVGGNGQGIHSDIFEIESEIDDQGYDFTIQVHSNGFDQWRLWGVAIEWYNAGWGGWNSWGWLVPQSGENTNGWKEFTAHLDSAPTGYACIDLRFDCVGAEGREISFDQVTFTATPEPASLLLLGLGGVGVLLRKRSR
jgi:hypothetical protein